jgi:triacylglycerol esterase/lipase EstA (alpha/beta hydrolase family)
MQEL